MTASATNFGAYYSLQTNFYGALLLTLYFELFPAELTPDSASQTAILDLRQALLAVARWPEMVTFEELNRSPPPLSPTEVLVAIWSQERFADGLLMARETASATVGGGGNEHPE